MIWKYKGINAFDTTIRFAFSIFCIVVAIGIMFFLGMGRKNVYAQDTGNVVVSYMTEGKGGSGYPQYISYPLVVKVSGAGEVRYSSDIIRDSSKNYLFVVNTNKTFDLIADKDAKVDAVYLNQDNIITQVKENTLTIKGIWKKQVLEVYFVNKSDQKGDSDQNGDSNQEGGSNQNGNSNQGGDSNQNGNSNQGGASNQSGNSDGAHFILPKTGDIMKPAFYLFLIIISLVLGFCLYLSEKKKKYRCKNVR